jgi:hypothetical protein
MAIRYCRTHNSARACIYAESAWWMKHRSFSPFFHIALNLHFRWWPIKFTFSMMANQVYNCDEQELLRPIWSFSFWSTQNWATFSLFLTWSSVWNIQTVPFPSNWHNLLHISLCLNNKYLNNYNQSEPSDQHKIELHLSLNLALHFPNRCVYLKYSNYLIPMNCP